MLPLSACNGQRGAPDEASAPAAGPASPAPPAAAGADPHSFARPDHVGVSHLDLDLAVDFDRRALVGTATLTLDRWSDAGRVVFDTRDLDVHGVTLIGGAGGEALASHTFGDEVPYLGRSLTIQIQADTRAVRVAYATRPEAAALQWLTPEQTAGGQQPFLFTQSQSILART